MLEIAGLARSTFFYHQARLNQPDPHAELKEAISEEFARARGRYGHRRIHTMLTRRGWKVAKKTVLKLMQALGLKCKARRRRRYLSFKGQVAKTAPNLLDRQFTAPAPNTKWVTDVTEFSIGDRKVYLSPIIDLFDRSVVAYTWGPSPSLDLTNSSLQAAAAQLVPGEHPLVHTDQGFQYQHESWRKILKTSGMTPSMSRKGTCLDNAMAESFFGQLKEEIFHQDTYTGVDDFTTTLEEYITWYNTERISTALGGMSPIQYRTTTPIP